MRHRDIVAILVDHRNDTAVNVQKILTAWGCMIKTRVGIHDGVLDKCSQNGLIILEVVGDDNKIDEFIRKINLLKGAQAKHMRLSPLDSDA
jgi:hypothetical protein